MRAGLRYVLHEPVLQAILVRGALFMVCGSALQALLHVLAADLQVGSIGFGVLMGCFGVGAVTGAALLPHVRRRVAIDLLVAGATVLLAAMQLVAATVDVYPVLCVAMIAGGMAWLTMLSSFNTSVQKSAPDWVRARALSLHLLVFFGGMAAGSALWGAVADHTDVRMALALAALGLVAGLTVAPRFRLAPAHEVDVRPAEDRPEPAVAAEPVADLGPVLVMVEYRVDPTSTREFAAAMHPVYLERKRNGAARWSLFSDPEVLGRYVECFAVESWVEYLRKLERMTVEDRAAEQRALVFHTDDAPPRVSYLVAEPLTPSD